MSLVPIEVALPGQTHADALAVPVAQPLGGEGARIVDEKLGGRLAKLLESGEFRGDRGEADATITTTAETFDKIVAGEQNPTTAYMTGKLKIKGDMGAAMKLQKIF